MPALALALLLLAVASYMMMSARRFHIAPIFWCGSWGLMLLLYWLLGSVYEYARWVLVLTGGCIAAWMAGHFLVARLEGRRKEPRPKSPRTFQFRRMRTLMAAATGIGMIAPINWLATTGFGVDQVTSLSAVNGIAQASYELLLEQRVEQDWINKLTLLVALAGIIVAGIYIGVGRPIDHSIPPKLSPDGSVAQPPQPTPYWMLLAPFLPYVAMMALSTIRTLLIVPLLMLLCSWIAGLYLRGRERWIFRASMMLPLIGMVFATALVLVYMQAVRDGDPGLQRLGDTIAALRLWVAGYEPGLVAWLKRGWDGQYQWGASTFRVIAGIFGADDTKLVYGTGAVDIGNNESSNAMTALRFFIEDWGLVGAVIFCLLFGLLCGWLSEQMRRGKLLVAPVYALILATVIFAPNSWFLNYGSRVFSPVLAIGFMLFFCSQTGGEESENGQSGNGPKKVRRVRRSRSGGDRPRPIPIPVGSDRRR